MKKESKRISYATAKLGIQKTSFRCYWMLYRVLADLYSLLCGGILAYDFVLVSRYQQKKRIHNSIQCFFFPKISFTTWTLSKRVSVYDMATQNVFACEKKRQNVKTKKIYNSTLDRKDGSNSTIDCKDGSNSTLDCKDGSKGGARRGHDPIQMSAISTR